MGIKKLLPDKVRVAANSVRQDLSNIKRALTHDRRPPFASRSARRRPTPSQKREAAKAAAAPEQETATEAIATTGAVAVFAHSGVEVVVEPGQTILEAGLEAGVDLIFSCGLGGCGACMLTCTDGEVEYDDVDATCLLPQDIEEGLCLACVGRPRGRIILDA